MVNLYEDRERIIDMFKDPFEDMFLDKLIESKEQNQEIFGEIVEDKSFSDSVKEKTGTVLYSSAFI